jgi:ribosomal protein S18 acetylase RimI-like enzyme
LDTAADVRRILDFRTGIAARSSTRTIPFRYGRAFFNDDYPRSWAHNFLRVERPEQASAGDLIADADRLHADAGHSHRMVEIDDERAAKRLERQFERAGWAVDRHVVMAHRRPFDRDIALDVTEQLSFEEVKPAHEEFWRTSPFGDSEETVRQLVERTLVTVAAADVRHFAVRSRGEVVSTCDLYVDGHTAQVEDVWTRPEERGRGFARALVARAVHEANAAGCDLVWLEADADDWPQELYRKLGFDRVACTYAFYRSDA